MFPYIQLTRVLSENGFFDKYRHLVTRNELNPVRLCVPVEEAKNTPEERFKLSIVRTTTAGEPGGTYSSASCHSSQDYLFKFSYYIGMLNLKNPRS